MGLKTGDLELQDKIGLETLKKFGVIPCKFNNLNCRIYLQT